ncbi:ASCH domain-containing protein [Aeromonas tecta]|uniref:ASCH domain-containing protein n=1 Tax=Aeromonas tecta TaxID=324617 RepID=UPI0006805C30|nr:ASCH domain-containing protein [Aeromonas tecta]
MTPSQQAFMDAYLSTLSAAQRSAIPQLVAEHFCADEANANECAKLIAAGIKRASCSLKAAYEKEQEPLPQVGRLCLVLSWAQQPVCIVRLTEVSVCPFEAVDAAFAAAEGEGDGTLVWWRDAHMAFFTAFAREVGVPFNPQSELVLERFEKVYPG